MLHTIDRYDGPVAIRRRNRRGVNDNALAIFQIVDIDNRVGQVEHDSVGCAVDLAVLLANDASLDALLNDELNVQDLTLVLQDWGGLIGGAYALRNPERVKRLFIMNTILPIYEPGTEERMASLLDNSRWFGWVGSAIEDGSLPFVLGSLNVTVLSMMKLIGFENLAQVNDTWVAAYSAPFGTREECKGAIAVECPAGSLPFWDGSVWHGNWERETVDVRVVLHITFSRLALRPVECYDFLDDEWLVQRPDEMRIILGREDFLNTQGGAFADPMKLRRTFNWAKN